MAGEVGHVVYAARLLTYLGERVQDPSYWVGTLFPDIRHLGVVSRNRTHPRDVTLKSLIGANDFQTGLRVHAWIDATREQFLRDHHLKEKIPWHPFAPFCLNLLEDELLYSHFDDWNLINRALNRTYPDEAVYCSVPATLKTWHTILQQYLLHPPSDASRRELARAIGLSENMAEESTKVIQLLKDNKATHALLDEFWRHLEDLLR